MFSKQAREVSGSHISKSSANLSPPEIYAHRVLAYSKLEVQDSYFSGAHYSRLGRFLISPSQTYGDKSSEIVPSNGTSFVTICILGMEGKNPERFLSFKQPEDFEKYLRSCQCDMKSVSTTLTGDEFSKAASQPNSSSGSRIVFLQGVPSPQWLNQLGASFDIDPEFLYRHMEVESSFLPKSNSLCQLYSPPFPITRDIFELRICNTGSWEPSQPRLALSELRKFCQHRMHQSLENYTSWRGIRVGDSIVRRFSVHDLHHFTIEQKITVEVIYHTQQWTAIVWLDSGNDLALSTVGPWLEGSNSPVHAIRLHPIYQHRSRIALSSQTHRKGSQKSSLDNQGTTWRLPQTITHLPSNYGRFLKPELMEEDAFYALSDLFNFSAASVNQLMELLEDKVRRIIIDQPTSGLSELLIMKALIDEYRQNVRDTSDMVHVRGSPNWPRTREDRWVQKTDRTAKELELRYSRLCRRCDGLSEQCGSGISILTDARAQEQSQKAIQQTDKVTKLTFLAYIFVPLSFSASFFGMNFKELERGLSIYAFFIMAFVILSFSLFVWFCDLAKFFAMLWHALVHLWRTGITRQREVKRMQMPIEV